MAFKTGGLCQVFSRLERWMWCRNICWIPCSTCATRSRPLMEPGPSWTANHAMWWTSPVAQASWQPVPPSFWRWDVACCWTPMRAPYRPLGGICRRHPGSWRMAFDATCRRRSSTSSSPIHQWFAAFGDFFPCFLMSPMLPLIAETTTGNLHCFLGAWAGLKQIQGSQWTCWWPKPSPWTATWGAFVAGTRGRDVVGDPGAYSDRPPFPVGTAGKRAFGKVGARRVQVDGSAIPLWEPWICYHLLERLFKLFIVIYLLELGLGVLCLNINGLPKNAHPRNVGMYPTSDGRFIVWRACLESRKRKSEQTQERVDVVEDRPAKAAK